MVAGVDFEIPKLQLIKVGTSDSYKFCRGAIELQTMLASRSVLEALVTLFTVLVDESHQR
jgi:hypothetical protein